MTSGAQARAEQSVARRFSRQMRACTSPLGALTDPPLVALVEAVLLVGSIVVHQAAPDRVPVSWLYWIVAAPLLFAVLVWLSLGGARRRVVGWLATVPFPVDNINALLNGVGQTLLVRFDGPPPERAALNAALEQVHTDSFALEYADDEPVVEVRIGVLDSKLNPAGAAHRRFLRARRLVDECLVPLSDDHPIVSVRVC